MRVTLGGLLGRERFLAIAAGTAAAFLTLAPELAALEATAAGMALICLWLFLTVLGCCLAVVRHAEHLALRFGEPYGTLILTLAVTAIEVMSISSLALQGGHDPALARDTVYAVIMILLNFMVGLSLLLGGWRHLEQRFNLQGANTYLGVIIPLTVLSLILPNFTMTTPGPTLSGPQEGFVVIVSIGLYAAFLAVQTVRHRPFFTDRADDAADAPELPHGAALHPAAHVMLLTAYMAPLVFLAEELAHPLNGFLGAVRAPAALAGVAIALLVATPEAVSAVRAAAANRLQRAMNIFLGSVLSTIGLTIPAMIAVSAWTGQRIVLGLQNAQALMLVLTLAVSMVTFSSGRTHVLQGAVHLVLFGAYILLIFQG